MTVLTMIVLALLQDFTELLPISPSACPILVPDQGSTADAALHLGPVFAKGTGVQ